MQTLLKIVPPLWLIGLLVSALLLHYFVPATRVFTVSYPIAGIIVLAAGLVLSNFASSLFSREKTEILPTSETNRKLVTYGPFAYSRNPMYLGMVLSLLGIALWVGTLPVFVAAIVDFCILNFVFIPFEEEKLTRIFGSEYLAYKDRVRRWI